MQNSSLHNFLTTLGLTSDERELYATLTENGPLTILELSRRSGVNRTKIYRLLEELAAKGFVEELIDEGRKLLKASDLKKLELMLKEQENKVHYLKELFPEVSALIAATTSLAQPGTRVLFYRGEQGIKQMAWNTLKAKDEIVGYSYRKFSEIVGAKLDNQWVEEMKLRSLTFRDLISDTYLKSLKHKSELKPMSDGIFQTRYVAPGILEINHQMDIYNDVVSVYNWHEGETFGVEIYNLKIAKMQKQLFELVWQQASEQLPI